MTNLYLSWLVNRLEAPDDFLDNYSQLCEMLLNWEFVSKVRKDDNRAVDAAGLRNEFHFAIEGPISLLEVMISLALRCERDIMHDPDYGNRSFEWFWYMICSLGFRYQLNGSLDEHYILTVLKDFDKRKYSADGKGSLFFVENCDLDMRKTEIWFQMNKYLTVCCH